MWYDSNVAQASLDVDDLGIRVVVTIKDNHGSHSFVEKLVEEPREWFDMLPISKAVQGNCHDAAFTSKFCSAERSCHVPQYPHIFALHENDRSCT